MKYRSNLPYVIDDLTFRVRSMEKIGIVGRTGSGKSTLLLGILRIIEASKGAIFIDDIDISTLDLSDLRSRLTIIPQDPTLYRGTLRKNLDPDNRLSDLQIERVL